MSELKKLWDKRNKLSKRIDFGYCKVTLIDTLLLPVWERQLKQVNYEINHFDPKRDEYDWSILGWKK